MFHHAGGSSLAFRGWEKLFPASWSVDIVDLPGRGLRSGEDLVFSMDRIVDEFVGRASDDGASIVLIGHSMGALIAYECARRLEVLDSERLALLAVSAFPPPPLDGRRAGSSQNLLSDEDLRNWVRSTGGSPSRLVDSDLAWRSFAPIFKADFAVVDSWTPGSYSASISAPIVVFGGHDDPLVREEHLLDWRSRTTRFVGCTMFPGDHFYLWDARVEIATMVSEIV